ncbi:MAG: hypothetical protein CMI25_06260 [Opitutae bacterium]|nr:hypothetical protein [Opitutae bacterium]
MRLLGLQVDGTDELIKVLLFPECQFSITHELEKPSLPFELKDEYPNRFPVVISLNEVGGQIADDRLAQVLFQSRTIRLFF